MSDLYIERIGQGPVVVLLHGTPSPPDHFAALAKALSSRYCVMTPHLPGYGRTPPMREAWTLAERDDRLIRSLIGRGVHKAHLLGFSAGTLRALSIALSGAIEVCSLFSISGLCALWPDERAGFRALAEALRAGQDLSHLAAQRFLTPGFAAAHPEALADVQGWMTAVDPGNLSAELQALADDLDDLTPRLLALNCPVTARAGTEDLAVPIAHSEQMIAAVTHGSLQRVKGAGHALLLEDFDATAAAVARSLEAADGST